MGETQQSPNRQLACVDAVREEATSYWFYNAKYIAFYTQANQP